MDMKRFFLGFIMMIAVAMVGCNGNGGGNMPGTGGGGGTPTPSDVDLTKLLSGYLMIPASGLEFTIKAGETKTLGDYVVFSCPSGGADCMVTVTRNPDGTIMGATSSGGMATAAPSQMAQDAHTAKMARISAIGKHHAANVPSNCADSSNCGNSLPALPKKADAHPTATAIVLAGGGKITVTDGPNATRLNDVLDQDDDGNDGTSNIPNATEFMMQSKPALPPIPITGWKASVHQRNTTEKITDTLTVYQNNMPDDQAIQDTYPNSGAAYISDRTLSNNELTLTFAASGINNKTSAYFMGAGFPTTAGTFVTTKVDDTATDVKENEFEGTFRGVSGTYACTGGSGNCTVRRTADTLVFEGNAWTFKAKAADKITGALADMDYLAFGYWVRTTSGTNGMTYDVAAFGEGSDDFAVDSVSSVKGTANYAGPAAGLFATRTFATDGTSTITDGGEFTAKVNLTANFGGQSLAFDKQWRIMGTVKDFMDSTGKIIDSNWMLDLDKVMLATVNSAGTDYENHVNAFNGTTSMNDRVNGVWKGMFYGVSDDVGGVMPQPSSVAGQFGAKFSNGEVLGGFGATKQ